MFKYVFYEQDCSFDYNSPQGTSTVIDFLQSGFFFDKEKNKIEGFGELENLFFEKHKNPMKTLCDFLAHAIYWGKITIDDVTKMRNETGIINVAQEFLIEKMEADIEMREAAANLLYEEEKEREGITQ